MTMLPSSKATAAFVAVFVIGGIVGAFIGVDVHDMTLPDLLAHTSDPVSNAARINQKYIRNYHLSADEQARIAPLTREMARRLYLARRQFGVDIIATLDDYHHKIGEEMTPEHRAVFEQANAARRKQLSSVLLLDPPDSGAGQK